MQHISSFQVLLPYLLAHRSWGTSGDHVVGTTLLASPPREVTDPFIFLNANAGVLGLSVFYPAQTPDLPSPLVYPPTIMGSGDDVTVKNVLLVNPYFGIDFATHPCGRHLIDGVYGQPLSIGIQVVGSGGLLLIS